MAIPRLAVLGLLSLSSVLFGLSACWHRTLPGPGPALVADEPHLRFADSLTPKQRLMVAALTEVRTGRAAESRPAWRQALTDDSALHDYHLYYLGLANASAGDRAEAQRTFRTLLEEEPKSVLIPAASLHLGRLLMKESPKEAIRHLGVARKGFSKGTPEWTKASLLLAKLELDEQRPKVARRIIDEVRERVPPGVARRKARRAARRIDAAAPVADRPGRASTEAALLIREGDPTEAERLLREVLDDRAPSRHRPRLLTTLASAQHAQGRLEDADRTLADVVRKYPRHVLAPRASMQRARWRWNRDEDELALERFQEFSKLYPRDVMVPDALVAIGRIHQNAGRFESARAAYDRVADRFPGSRQAEEARWRIGWLEYTAADYDGAARSFETLAATAKRLRTKEEALYWQARALERRGAVSEATDLLGRVLADFPSGFYAGWAAERLALLLWGSSSTASPPEAVAERESEKDSKEESFDDTAAERVPVTPVSRAERSRSLSELEAEPGATGLDVARFSRAVELGTMGLFRLAERELDAIPFPPRSNLESRVVLLEAYALVGSHRRALRSLPAKGLSDEKTDPLDRFRYPRAHWELVEHYSRRHAIDPYMVVSLMRQESVFDARAVSPKGARGLMQLMPATAERMARSLGLSPPNPRDLTRPAVNIALGTAYLGELFRRYEGAPQQALAAYNAGEGAVEKWMRRSRDAAPDEFVEQISYPETRGYVKAVLRNHRIYRTLYGKDRVAPGFGADTDGAYPRS